MNDHLLYPQEELLPLEKRSHATMFVIWFFGGLIVSIAAMISLVTLSDQATSNELTTRLIILLIVTVAMIIAGKRLSRPKQGPSTWKQTFLELNHATTVSDAGPPLPQKLGRWGKFGYQELSSTEAAKISYRGSDLYIEECWYYKPLIFASRGTAYGPTAVALPYDPHQHEAPVNFYVFDLQQTVPTLFFSNIPNAKYRYRKSDQLALSGAQVYAPDESRQAAAVVINQQLADQLQALDPALIFWLKDHYIVFQVLGANRLPQDIYNPTSLQLLERRIQNIVPLIIAQAARTLPQGYSNGSAVLNPTGMAPRAAEKIDAVIALSFFLLVLAVVVMTLPLTDR